MNLGRLRGLMQVQEVNGIVSSIEGGERYGVFSKFYPAKSFTAEDGRLNVHASDVPKGANAFSMKPRAGVGGYDVRFYQLGKRDEDSGLRIIVASVRVTEVVSS